MDAWTECYLGRTLSRRTQDKVWDIDRKKQENILERYTKFPSNPDRWQIRADQKEKLLQELNEQNVLDEVILWYINEATPASR